MKEQRSLVVSTWIPEQIAHEIQTIADRERRSRSSVLRNLLLDTFGAQVINGELSDEEENEKQS